MTILVVGGAGYIGSHVVRLLSGQEVVAVDDLSTGLAARLGATPMVRCDVTSATAVEDLVRVMREYAVETVVHFAAKKQVGESVERPSFYFFQNVGGLANVVEAMQHSGVGRLLFSSSAAAYGDPPDATSGYFTEDLTCAPVSPYGETKLIGEWLCRDAERAWGLSWAGLRYFNVAGCGWPDLGDSAVLNLIPIVFSRLDRGLRPQVYGDDYDTPDGTCIRDYVHVLDLAEAHVALLGNLGSTDHRVFNVGTGVGSSVLEVLTKIGEVSGRDAAYQVVGRRPGDAAVVAADVSRIAEAVGWRARLGLGEMVSSAWEAWRRSGPTAV